MPSICAETAAERDNTFRSAWSTGTPGTTTPDGSATSRRRPRPAIQPCRTSRSSISNSASIAPSEFLHRTAGSAAVRTLRPARATARPPERGGYEETGAPITGQRAPRRSTRVTFATVLAPRCLQPRREDGPVAHLPQINQQTHRATSWPRRLRLRDSRRPARPRPLALGREHGQALPPADLSPPRTLRRVTGWRRMTSVRRSTVVAPCSAARPGAEPEPVAVAVDHRVVKAGAPKRPDRSARRRHRRATRGGARRPANARPISARSRSQDARDVYW